MKILFLLSLQAFAGSIDRSPINTSHFVIRGESRNSIEDAKQDALSQLPKGWVLDNSWTSPILGCVEGAPIYVDDEREIFTCDFSIPDNKFLYTFHIKKIN